MTNVGEQRIKNRICFDNAFASYIIVSSGPKKSNTNFFKKRAVFPVTKDIGLIFPVLSSVTNVREQYIRVQKLFQHSLWKLEDLLFRTYEVLENTKF